MGKKSRTKDRMHMTASEWAREFGGYKPGPGRASTAKYLPFDHCAMTLTPFSDPVCTRDGLVFDISNIIPYVKKHGKNPVSGDPLAIKDLILLHYHKNPSGQYHCPLTFKVFNANSHIVAIATSGNVFAYDAVEQLNLKPKIFTDLLSGEKFTKDDLIVLQDPNAQPRLVTPIKPIEDAVVKTETVSTAFTGKRLPKRQRTGANTATTASTTDAAAPKVAPAKPPTYHFSTGACAASFTSSAVTLITTNELEKVTDDDLRAEKYSKLKGTGAKAFVRLVTNKGQLNLQLEAELAPFASHNFILLCQSGYYNNVIFHRLIKNFMVQGGDPTGTGRGGESFWKHEFRDELKTGLSHDARGVLSMANAGPNTNNSQFFITFRAASHLDGKHTVFGRLVGGDETLDKIEEIAVGRDDRPVSEIKILSTEVFVDPFKDIMESPSNEVVNASKPKTRDDDESYLAFSDRMVAKSLPSGVSQVGKYLKQKPIDHGFAGPEPVATSAPANSTKYGNFDNF